MALGATLLIITIITHGPYYLGPASPPWDFFGAYHSDAYYWWTNVGFSNSIPWNPYLWGGYPLSASWQNSAWYLPVGVFSFLFGYTIHSAAALSAIHVVFGAVGAYALVRGYKLGFFAGLFAAVAWYFAQGFYANAQHLDIVRGYAFLPWLLLVTSSIWPWRRAWAVPVAASILWQAAMGVYPGILIAGAYCIPLWIFVHLCHSHLNRFRYVGGILLSLVIALLLSAPKFLPFALIGSSGAASNEEASAINGNFLFSLFFAQNSDILAGDISMRSMFLPVAAFVLVAFGFSRAMMPQAALSVLLISILLGWPGLPWFALAQDLPGMTASRFSFSDFKAFGLFALLLLAAAGLQRILVLSSISPRARWRPELVRVVPFLVALGLATYIATSNQVPVGEWLPMLAVAGLTVILLGLLAVFAHREATSRLLASLVIGATALSGFVWVNATSVTWRIDRVEAEIGSFGAPLQSIISTSTQDGTLDRRPERIPLPEQFDRGVLYSETWNRYVYSGDFAIGGYINLKGVDSQGMVESALLDENLGSSFARLMGSSGMVVPVEALEIDGLELLASCIDASADVVGCGGIEVSPRSYSAGQMKFEVSVETAGRYVLNESYYPGWDVRACAVGSHSSCLKLAAQSSPQGLIQLSLPSGEHELVLTYVEPGGVLGRALFVLGWVVAFAWMVRGRRIQRA